MGQKMVAICSRDSERNYEWLKDFLEKRMCKKTRINVQPVYITNNMFKFHQEISGFNFAILYHTKNRGRINITNVNSSLYDNELKCLHDRFGKKNVVVVIDDLEKSGDDEKRRIKEQQRDLKKYAQELFLFTEQDKNHTKNHLNTMEITQVKENLIRLKKYIKSAKRTSGPGNAICPRRIEQPLLLHIPTQYNLDNFRNIIEWLRNHHDVPHILHLYIYIQSLYDL
ncbi:uncharacterized protein LOC143923336 [Lithobates pipiens]